MRCAHFQVCTLKMDKIIVGVKKVKNVLSNYCGYKKGKKIFCQIIVGIKMVKVLSNANCKLATK